MPRLQRDLRFAPTGFVEYWILVTGYWILGYQFPAKKRVSSIKHRVSSIKHRVSSIEYRESSIENPVSSNEYPVSCPLWLRNVNTNDIHIFGSGLGMMQLKGDYFFS
jgi:hypothetical protein